MLLRSYVIRYPTHFLVIFFYFSLDPDNDPLGILLMLDFYAIRAQQHAWFVEFVKSWDPKKNLAQLPNIAYSLALATFYSGSSAAGKNNSVENANLEADEKLQRALIDFPGKYVPFSSHVNNQS